MNKKNKQGCMANRCSGQAAAVEMAGAHEKIATNEDYQRVLRAGLVAQAKAS